VTVDWSALEEARPFPGVRARRLDTAGATLVRYEFEPGAGYPEHAHPEEQVVVVLSGEGTFHAGGEAVALRPGGVLTTPGGLPHRAVAGPGGVVFVNIVVPRRPPTQA
jgi:quercetin dioxygenase-like cupin family protein